MPLYLSISEGADGTHTRPIFATSDPAIIAAVARALTRRLTGDQLPPRLRGLRRPATGETEAER